jgi:hypothetical protein
LRTRYGWIKEIQTMTDQAKTHGTPSGFRPIEQPFALDILQAHIRNAIELDGKGRYKPETYIEGTELREAVIARVLEHTAKLVISIYENPADYELGQ